MKIETRKITSNPKKFFLHLISDSYKVNVEGSLSKLDNGLIKINSIVNGDINLVCDLSGENFKKSINENITLFAKDGIWNSHKDKDYCDVIEFFDGYIDLEFIFKGELESIQLDYHTKE